ncbi:MAG TPA: helix-turn-helix domain-containing protein [Solirubrobacteraceae bacterium]|nr:helix-turn-helix domain-containing protein [Solirubrobacteraceae bacterium]
MPRRTPPGRIQDVARAACEVFIAKGYRRALMTDVAERLGLSHAILYRSVEGKEALLELAARYAMDPGADLEAVVPLPTPPPGHILTLIRSWLTARARFPALRAALDREPDGDAAAELAAIIDELYGFIEHNRLLLLLIESLVEDYPGLSAESVNDRKRAQHDRLTAFLSSRAAAGALRPLPDPAIAAHFLAESVAWFAQHRQRDPDAATIDDQQARSTVRDLLLAAFVPDSRPTATGR